MIRGLYVFILSLVASLCLAQESAGLPLETAPVGSSPGSYVRDLVHIVRENTKVILNWRLIDTSVTDFVSIERSCNSRDFEVVAVIKLNEVTQWFEWIDEAPAKGRNIYRIKCANRTNQVIYSQTVEAIIAGDISFKFYPNPVDNVLIIRSENPLDIQIIDAIGKVRFAQANVRGLQTISVSTLEKGIYILRLHNRLANTVIQERLLKN